MNRDRERGVAILLTLAALVLVTAATAALARLASTAQIGRCLDRDTAAADDLLREASKPIEAWLTSEGARVVLPPDSLEPRASVLDDRWEVAGIAHALTITAFDQNGMVPIELARSASPLRTLLPEPTLDELRRSRPRGRHEGLDLLQAEAERSIFPAHPTAVVVTGATLATHGGSRVNVATAPMRLVEEALRLAGRGGIEAISAAREKGKLPSVPAPVPGRLASRSAPEIVSTSSAWAFRIDLRVGTASRSWWEVHEHLSGSFRLVQRLAIPL
jgi:hypothetical protein